MENQDKVLRCKDCGNDFTLTSGEQEFYASKGFSEPQRCGECRRARKMQNNERNNGNYDRR
jgi:DNA replicative helicase MCM subunit Mcm2 (Cdc46/Mcm family)